MDARKLANAQSAAGKSLLEMLWEELDSVVDHLMVEEDPDPEMKGQAQGLSYAIAVITNPYKVSVPAIKEQCMERWESRNAE